MVGKSIGNGLQVEKSKRTAPPLVWLERRVLKEEAWLIKMERSNGVQSRKALDFGLRDVGLFSWQGEAIEGF